MPPSAKNTEYGIGASLNSALLWSLSFHCTWKVPVGRLLALPAVADRHRAAGDLAVVDQPRLVVREVDTAVGGDGARRALDPGRVAVVAAAAVAPLSAATAVPVTTAAAANPIPTIAAIRRNRPVVPVIRSPSPVDPTAATSHGREVTATWRSRPVTNQDAWRDQARWGRVGAMTDLKPRSRDVTDGMERAAARGMLRAVGMRDEDFAKPQIGIASSWNEITPCNLSLQRLGHRREGGRAPGGRVPDGVRHDLGLRRDLDGPRRDALLAGQPRDHRRLGGDGRAGGAPRRHRAARGLRQEPARHADGRRPARPRRRVRLRGLDPARARSATGRSTSPTRSRPSAPARGA